MCSALFLFFCVFGTAFLGTKKVSGSLAAVQARVWNGATFKIITSINIGASAKEKASAVDGRLFVKSS